MPRHFQDFEGHPKKFPRGRRLDQEVGLDRVDLELETEVAKIVAIGNHRRAVRVNAHREAEAALDLRHVLDVIDVAMR